MQKRIKHFKVGNPHDDDQLRVEVYPKHKQHDRSDIDVVCFKLKERDMDALIHIYMTPDEGLEIANALSTAAMFWLITNHTGIRQ